MQNRSFLLICLLALSVHSNAQIGSKEEVTEAALDEEEPAYIKVLNHQLSHQLYLFVQNHDIKSPRQKLAWWLTMRSIIGVIQKAASEATKYASANFNGYLRSRARPGLEFAENYYGIADWTASWNAVSPYVRPSVRLPVGHTTSDAAQKVPRCITRESAKKALGSACEDAMVSALQTASNKPVIKRSSLAYRIAEWEMLNYLFKNIWIVETIYQVSLQSLPVNPENNPFSDREKWNEFWRRNFAGLESKAMVFVLPWLSQIVPMDWIEPVHRPLLVTMNPWPLAWEFFSGWFSQHTHASIFSFLCRDVVQYILKLVIVLQSLPSKKPALTVFSGG